MAGRDRFGQPGLSGTYAHALIFNALAIYAHALPFACNSWLVYTHPMQGPGTMGRCTEMPGSALGNNSDRMQCT